MSELRDPVKLFGWTITTSLSPVLRDLFDDHGKDNTSLQISSSSTDLNNNGDDDQHSEITTTTTTTELKKPDKILPCPRCKSKDTKFCYYNNYNVNQPRHFCRNCQRYWTAGGSRRTIPVGSGRRKTKAWISSIHMDTSNHNSSSTKILSFNSSDSLVSQKGLLPQQVTSLANPSFYPIPVYWGCTVPFWSTQVQTSTCLEKTDKRRRFT